MNEIQEFYNQHHFPGYYTIQSITNFDVTTNRYVNIINGQLSNGQRVLDVGCGTGLLTNLFAAKYKKSQFTGLDFSTAVDYAKDFAKQHDIKNVKYIKKDFFEFENNEKYDVIIAQSFLTHVPNWPEAVKKLKSLLTQHGVILLGVYHPAGKLAKKFINVNYKNDRLELDQESNPFEIAYTKRQVSQMFSEFKFLQITPSVFTKLVGFVNIFNYKNGGLTVYALTRK